MTAPDEFAAARAAMLHLQIAARGILDSRVLRAMGDVPRHEFVAPHLKAHAYDDGPLPIGQGQTISQPYIVARMTELLEVAGHHRVLEIGSGCGYQTAVLCRLAGHVYAIERLEELAPGRGIISGAPALRTIPWPARTEHAAGRNMPPLTGCWWPPPRRRFPRRWSSSLPWAAE